MNIRKILSCVLCVGLLTGLLGSCGSGNGAHGNSPSPAEPVAIVASDNGWDSQKLHNEIAKIVVEQAYEGYTFSVSSAGSTLNWLALLDGSVDLDIESWTDNVASYPEDLAKGDVVNMGILVPDSSQGLYVPRFVVEGDTARGIAPMAPDLRTVADLKKYPEVFPDDENPSMGRMYGSIPGWMADEVLHQKYEFYGLNESFTYVRLGSEATLFASLVSAYNLGEPWVGYCYEPTWVTGKLDLILLEDAPYDADLFPLGQCAFPSQDLKIVSSRSFAERAPDLVSFFESYQTGSILISEALAHLDESGASHRETAIWLLKNNDAILNQWLPAENAAKLRSYLETV